MKNKHYSVRMRLLTSIVIISFLSTNVIRADSYASNISQTVLAAQSIFKPILDNLGLKYQSRIETEMSIIISMALKGLNEKDESLRLEYMSRLNINAALDKYYSNDIHLKKLLELTENPKKLNDGSLEINLRIMVPGGEEKEFTIIFTGKNTADMLDGNKIIVIKKLPSYDEIKTDNNFLTLTKDEKLKKIQEIKEKGCRKLNKDDISFIKTLSEFFCMGKEDVDVFLNMGKKNFEEFIQMLILLVNLDISADKNKIPPEAKEKIFHSVSVLSLPDLLHNLHHLGDSARMLDRLLAYAKTELRKSERSKQIRQKGNELTERSFTFRRVLENSRILNNPDAFYKLINWLFGFIKEELEFMDEIDAFIEEIKKDLPMDELKEFEEWKKISRKFKINIYENIRAMSAGEETGEKLKPVNLSESINKTIRLIFPFEGRPYRHKIDRKFHAEPITIHALESDLMHIWLNLLSNAREATEDSKDTITITTSLDEKKEYVNITFSDKGCGIPEEIKDKIFEPGFTPKEKGTGRGLPMVKKLAEKYNGTIKVASEPGKGAEFIIAIPLKNQPPEPGPEDKSVPPAKDILIQLINEYRARGIAISEDILDIILIEFLKENYGSDIKPNDWDSIQERINDAIKLLGVAFGSFIPEILPDINLKRYDSDALFGIASLAADADTITPIIKYDYTFNAHGKVNVAVLQRCWESESYGVINENEIGSSPCNIFYAHPDWIFEKDGKLFAKFIRFKNEAGKIIHAYLKEPIEIHAIFNVEQTWDAEGVIRILKQAVEQKMTIIGDPHLVSLGRKDLFYYALKDTGVQIPKTFVIDRELSRESFEEFKAFALNLADKDGIITLVWKPAFSGDGRDIVKVVIRRDALQSFEYNMIDESGGESQGVRYLMRLWRSQKEKVYSERFIAQAFVDAPKVMIKGALRDFSCAVFTSINRSGGYTAEPGVMILASSDESGFKTNISAGGKIIELEYLFENIYNPAGEKINLSQSERESLISQIIAMSEQMCDAFENWKNKNIEEIRKLHAQDKVFTGLAPEDTTSHGLNCATVLYSRNDIMFAFDRNGKLVPVAAELNFMPGNHLFAKKYAKGNSTLQLFKNLPYFLHSEHKEEIAEAVHYSADGRKAEVVLPKPTVSEIKECQWQRIRNAEKELVARFGYKGWNLLLAHALSKEIGGFTVPDFEIIEIDELWKPFYEANKAGIDEIVKINQVRDELIKALINVHKKYRTQGERRSALEKMFADNLSAVKEYFGATSLDVIGEKIKEESGYNTDLTNIKTIAVYDSIQKFFKEKIEKITENLNFTILQTVLEQHKQFLLQEDNVIFRTSATDEDTKDNSNAGKYHSRETTENSIKTAIFYFQVIIENNLHSLNSDRTQFAFIIQKGLEGLSLEGGVVFSNLFGRTLVELGVGKVGPGFFKQNPLVEATMGRWSILLDLQDDVINQVLYNHLDQDMVSDRYIVKAKDGKEYKITIPKETLDKVVRTAKEIESRLGYPVDIEFGVKGGEIYVVQLRPITKAASQVEPLPEFDTKDIKAEFPVAINQAAEKGVKLVFVDSKIELSNFLSFIQETIGFDQKFVICPYQVLDPGDCFPFLYGEKLFWASDGICRLSHIGIILKEEARHVVMGYFKNIVELKNSIGETEELEIPKTLREKGVRSITITKASFDIYSNGDKAVLVKAGAVPVISEDDEKRIKNIYDKNNLLLKKAAEYLKDYPVDMTIDLSLIPKEDLAKNMKTWAYLMLLHNDLGLDVNYIFESKDDDEYKKQAEKLLIEQLEELSLSHFMNIDKMKSKINKPHQEENKIIVPIMRLEELKKTQSIEENVFPVAMSEGKDIQGIILRDFHSAATLGLSQAACARAKTAGGEIFKEVIKEVFPRMEKVYKKLFRDEIFTVETLQDLIEYPAVRKNLAVTLALPPVTRMPIDDPGGYHNIINQLLQSA